jgi:hypothetical protein
MGEVHDQTAPPQVRRAQGIRRGLCRLGARHRHEAEASLAAVGVGREVDAHDSIGHRTVDQDLHFFLRGVVGKVAHVKRAIRGLGASARAARASRASRARAAADAETGASRPDLAARRLGLERSDRDGSPGLHRAVERVARRLRLGGRRKSDETEAARPPRRAVLRQADADDLASRCFEQLLEHVLRDAVGKTRDKQLRFLIRHAKTHDLRSDSRRPT